MVEYAYAKTRKGSDGNLRKRHYWKVSCANCRNFRTIEEYNLKPPAGGKCQNCWGRPEGQAGFLVLLDIYKKSAARLSRDFSLSDSEFKTLTNLPCHYCGVMPEQIKRGGKNDSKSHWGDYRHNGLDRVNNTKGYVLDNVVPCCKICNRAKNNMSYDSFMVYISRIRTMGQICLSA